MKRVLMFSAMAFLLAGCLEETPPKETESSVIFVCGETAASCCHTANSIILPKPDLDAAVRKNIMGWHAENCNGDNPLPGRLAETNKLDLKNIDINSLPKHEDYTEE